MNPEKQLILINGKDKTDSVSTLSYTGDGKCQVCFEGSSKVYSYNSYNIQILKPVGLIDPSSVIVFVKGNSWNNIEKILDFGEFYRFYYDGKWSASYPRRDVRIVQDCLTDEKARSLFDYFKDTAAAVGIVVEQGQNLLSLQYEKIKGISEETVLNKYFAQQGPEKRSVGKELIFPFGLNQSQKIAVENAFSSQISIIQGPPGTGKTQTILNIIANAVLNHQSVAVVSNNNSATSNVAEKLAKHDLAFLTAFLGSRENKNKFLENQHDYPNMASWELPHDEEQKLREQVKQLKDSLSEMLAARNRIASIEQERLLLEPEQTYFEQYYASCRNIEQEFRSLSKFSSAKISALWLEIEETSQNAGLNLWNRTSILFRFW